jgi:hypothetical protein
MCAHCVDAFYALLNYVHFKYWNTKSINSLTLCAKFENENSFL